MAHDVETAMNEDSSADGVSSTVSRHFSTKRRTVLQGIAALGLSSSVVGTTAARTNDTERTPDADTPPRRGVSTAIQFYTLRNLPDTVLDLIRRVGAVDNNGGPGYDAVEFAGLGEASADEIVDTLERTGLVGGSAHVGLEALETELETTVETYTQIGVDNLVVPYIDPSRIDTIEKTETLAERMNAVDEQLGSDVQLSYHNHDGEFQRLADDRTPLAVLDESLNDGIGFEIDVGWVHTAGFDPVEVIETYSDRTHLVHMKDMVDGEFAEIGEGAVDMRAVSAVARTKANVEYLIYEHDEPTDPAGSVATGAGVLSLLDGTKKPGRIELSEMGPPAYDPTLDGTDRTGGGNC
ncbi:sugar phosphate isomerase/epimerase family protein [Halocatena salina]|uniref:Sugar phosphate isomerase/epimerase n=1 Tax=Halocatena salina TaxID=2934340 RepID=A0A8U0A523_9EURY|nr:sugar phosphate isomerase/epimerase [Halocatena salina]UPM44311.1 sugar phosphate isomerase/epimerase [Halocatena salina]